MRFLSAEWLDRLGAAMSTASPAAALSVCQRVTGGPDGDVEYVLRLADGRVRVEPGPSATPVDVELTADYETAAAISQARLSPAAAFAGGRLRVAGDIGAIVERHESFAELGALLAGMAEATTY